MWTNGLQLAGGGTAFPSDPTAKDVYYRTDLFTFFAWTGTNWLPVGGGCPIGSIIAWHKSMTGGTPALPTGWVECNGQTLSDNESFYSGQVIPDLNGVGGASANRFLRGNTTSGTLRADNVRNHAHSISPNPHSHTGNSSGASGTTYPTLRNASTIDLSQHHSYIDSQSLTIGNPSGTGTGGTPDETYPRHMDVVWIMRVK